MRTIWIVNEGSPGHFSQSKGLAEAIASRQPVDVVTVTGRSLVRGWLRPLIRLLIGPSGRSLPKFLLNRIVKINIPPQSPTPDLLISSGGKSVFAARILATRYEVPYIFIGERKPFSADWFHTVISPVARESSSNSIDIEMIPTSVTPEKITHIGSAENHLWCMVIGGASRSHHYCCQDWYNLSEKMNFLAKKEKIKWLITTSRRTGEEVERILRNRIGSEFIEDAIWWASNPRKELYSFMARSQVLFVTQDSVTMTTESVSAGKAVVLLSPEKTFFSKHNFLTEYYSRLEKNRRLVRMKITEMNQLDTKILSNLNLVQNSCYDDMAEALLERLIKII